MASLNHKFMPIVSEERFKEAMEYVAATSFLLARKVSHTSLPIDTICFFAQSGEEYDYLLNAVLRRGPKSGFSHGPTTYVDTDFVIAGHDIKLLGVRQPDPARQWVGYGDYPVTDDEYIQLRDSVNPRIKQITSGRGQALLQFDYPDLDVLGFAFRQSEHDA